MTFEEQLLRRMVGTRAEKEKLRGRRDEVEPAVRPLDDRNRPQRDEARFLDQTGMSLLEMGLALPPVSDFSGPEQNTMNLPLLF